MCVSVRDLASYAWKARQDKAMLRAALERILERHDEGKCLCGGCCVADRVTAGKVVGMPHLSAVRATSIAEVPVPTVAN